MTTIAASVKEGVMVSDSRCTNGTTWFPSTKIYRIGGELIGCSGNVKCINKWLKWVRNGRKGPGPKLEAFSALTLRVDGLFKTDVDGAEFQIERGFHASGSGEHAAIAALLLGHTAIEAVEVACLVDDGSGGEIQVFNLKEA